ncbi:integrase arm-type DNA-binding domain-containing protein [Psychromonas sp. KJ10-10]|uniref:integrase arm-type DNA-binding domain-containing protein n=1 Tax=Psychromonas sp. KJ10-10 TaxID=3391823 RepID=UPI0039B66E19
MAKVLPLNDSEIKASKPKDKAYLIRDGAGLQLLIKPNGSKLWQLRYINPQTKKPALMGYGAYPAISLKDARKLRTSAKELLAKGLNPKEERDEEALQKEIAHNNTLIYVAHQWIEVKKVKFQKVTRSTYGIHLNFMFSLS